MEVLWNDLKDILKPRELEDEESEVVIRERESWTSTSCPGIDDSPFAGMM